MRWSAMLGAVVVLWIAVPCAAQQTVEDERAANHFRAGTSYLGEGRFEEALQEFSEAHRLSGRPQMLYNMGVALERLGRWGEAAAAYERFLNEAPDDPNRDVAVERLERARAHAPSEPPDSPDVVDASGAPSLDDDTAGAGPPGASDEDGAGPWPWVALGIGAAAGVASLVTGLVAHGIKGDLEERCTDGTCPADLRDDASTGESLATASTVLTFVALAGAAVGVTLLVVGGNDGEQRLEAAVVPGPNGVAATARLRF